MDMNKCGYPITIQLEAQACLVVGGGPVAERKVTALLQSGARVTVCSPLLTPALAKLAAAGAVIWRRETYRAGAAKAYFLVVAATDDDAVNQVVAQDARQAGRLVNVVTSPQAGNFQVAASVASGDLLLTVSTGGKSPALARLIRQELAELYGAEMDAFLQFLETQRLRLKEAGGSARERELFWRQVLRPEDLTGVRAGRREEIEGKIRDAVSRFGVKS